jgi:hypothetical protein
MARLRAVPPCQAPGDADGPGLVRARRRAAGTIHRAIVRSSAGAGAGIRAIGQTYTVGCLVDEFPVPLNCGVPRDLFYGCFFIEGFTGDLRPGCKYRDSWPESCPVCDARRLSVYV